MDLTKFKVEPLRLSLDDYVVRMPDAEKPEDRTEVRPFEGESVWVVPYAVSLEDSIDMFALNQALEDDDPAKAKLGADGMNRALAAMIVAWDITDIMGVPYEQPYNNPAVFARLPGSFRYFLSALVQGGEAAVKKLRGGSSSPATSSTLRGRAKTTRKA